MDIRHSQGIILCCFVRMRNRYVVLPFMPNRTEVFIDSCLPLSRDLFHVVASALRCLGTLSELSVCSV